MQSEQAKYEKTKHARKKRDVFGGKLTIRLDFAQAEELQELSDKTGRSVSDLVRSGVRLVTDAGRAVRPWKQES